jgi:RNA polymerase sigma factor (sigma-70 family)
MNLRENSKTKIEKAYLTESSFIAQLKSGDEQAFQQLIQEYQQKVLNTCYGFINSKEEAEDLTQDVFIEVFRSVRQFNGDSKLSTWLYRIAVTKSLEELRRRKRKKRAAYFKNLTGLDVAQEIVAAKDRNAQDLLEDEQRIHILQNAVDKLPENQRIAFTLHKYEQLSYKEVSDIMGVTLSAMESLMHRAKANLKKDLFDYYEKNII